MGETDGAVRGRHAPGHCSNVMLALAAPAVAQYPPTGHRLQLEALRELTNVPTGQLTQVVLPSSGWWLPGAQGIQLCLLAAPVVGI